MKKLKIAFVVPSFPNTTQTFIVNQITEHIDRGHEVRIFSFQMKYDVIVHQDILDYKLLSITEYYADEKISVIKRCTSFIKFCILNYNDFNLSKFIDSDYVRNSYKETLKLKWYTKYKWILDFAPFDIVHVHFGMKAPYIAEMRKLGYFSKTGLVVSFHGGDLPPQSLNTLKDTYESLFSEFDLVLANTNYTRGLIQKISNSDKIKILPVGLDVSYFKKSKSQNSYQFKILFVGRLINLKGPDLAVKILKSFLVKGYNNVQMTIVGEGRLRGEIKRLIDKYQLGDKVRLTGALSQQEIVKLMDISDIFLFPGIYDDTGRAETQGLVVQEAQAMELPVIVSDVGGIGDGMVNGETGFIVKEKDIEGFVDKIKLLIEDKSYRDSMGKKGRKFVLKNYDKKILGERLEYLYYSVIH